MQQALVTQMRFQQLVLSLHHITSYFPGAFVIHAEDFQLIDDAISQQVLSDIGPLHFSPADGAVGLDCDTGVDALVAESVAECPMKYPQKRRVGSKKTSMQMEHLRQLEMELCLTNLR